MSAGVSAERATESHPGDLEWWMFGNSDPDTDFQKRISLWEDDRGTLIAWSWLFKSDLEWYVRPDADTTALRARMLDHYDALADERRRFRSRPWETWSTGDQVELAERLAARGYERGDSYAHLAQAVSPSPSPEPQAAGRLRGAIGARPGRGQRSRSRASLAFEPSRMTRERYLRVMAASLYRPELDTVVEAPDGSIAAFALVWFDPQIKVGLFEPVGTHQEHRRRGLAAAACAEGLRRLSALGAHTADRAHRWRQPGRHHDLYASLGFREVMRSIRWKRRAAALDVAP